MAVTVHRISRYTVQVLTKRMGEDGHSLITVRLYDDDNVSRAVAVFEKHEPGSEPPKPTGDYKAQSATAYMDIAHYKGYMDILREEKTVYLKLGWSQQGKVRSLSHLSIDTKKEVIGDYFKAPAKIRT